MASTLIVHFLQSVIYWHKLIFLGGVSAMGEELKAPVTEANVEETVEAVAGEAVETAKEAASEVAGAA